MKIWNRRTQIEKLFGPYYLSEWLVLFIFKLCMACTISIFKLCTTCTTVFYNIIIGNEKRVK
jgi:hypothetical protein